MPNKKKKKEAPPVPETLQRLEHLQARVLSVAQTAAKVAQEQREGKADQNALKQTIGDLTSMATDLASEIARLQKDLGIDPQEVAGAPDGPPLPKGRGPIRG